MATKHTLFIALFGFFLVPLAIAAGAPPPNVNGISAALTDGKVSVSWLPVTDPTGIVNYRIYYSRTSILDNAGNYDDFEQVSGQETAYVFSQNPIAEGPLFVSVLAVNGEGTESEGFTAEASVDIPPTAAPLEQVQSSDNASALSSSSDEAASSAPSPETTTSEPLTIVTVRAVSSTGILVTFSKPVAADAVSSVMFSVTDTGGTALNLDEGVEVSGSDVLIRTAMQIPEKLYIVGLTQNVRAEDGTSATPSTPMVMFAGFGLQEALPQPEEPPVATTPEEPQPVSAPYGRNPDLTQPSPVPYLPAPAITNLPPENPVGLTLEPIQRKNGFYDVLARWAQSPDTQKTLQSYGLYTSTDGLQYGWRSLAGAGETAAKFTDVQPGVFGVRVTSRDAQGKESSGVERVVTLPASGAGLLGIGAVSGLLAWRRRRRQMVEAC